MNETDANHAQCDVAIVGYGPVGAVLGILLAQRGWHVTIVERWPAPYGLPRAIGIDGETLRIVQACGLGESLEHAISPALAYEWHNGKGELLLRFVSEGAEPSGWPASNFSQPVLEALLFDRAAGLPTLDVVRGVEITDVCTDDAGVVLTASSLEVRARYAVGCDGANSIVRERLALDVTDLGYFYDWLILDVVLDEPRVFDPPNLQICDPERPTTVACGGPGRRRWEFMRLPGEELDDLNQVDTAWRLLAPWDVRPDNAQLERHAVYRFQARWVEEWRRGRVFVAGDAAHQMPPFAGQGMCSGLKDVVNLAWKLDVVLRDLAPDALLDTYQAERRPKVKMAIETSIELGKVICITEPAAAAARDAAMIGVERPNVARVPMLTDGFVRSADAGASELFPQGRVIRDGRTERFDDAEGLGWRLLSTVRIAVDDKRRRWFEMIGGRVVVVDPAADAEGVYDTWMRDHDTVAVLQRPDCYVYGSVARDDATDGASRLLADLHAHLADPARAGSARMEAEA